MSKIKKFIKMTGKRRSFFSKNGFKIHKSSKERAGKNIIEHITMKKGNVDAGFLSGVTNKKINLRRVMEVYVDDEFRRKGLSTSLLHKFIKNSDRSTVTGSVISKGQINVRKQFDGTKVVHEGDKSSFVYTPNTSTKKHINKTTGKVRFVRIRGRIVPIKAKK
jgi:hypothetical protein